LVELLLLLRLPTWKSERKKFLQSGAGKKLHKRANLSFLTFLPIFFSFAFKLEEVLLSSIHTLWCLILKPQQRFKI
jgi:hypothetical protein